jgi:polysaccharide export outer membrane protein
MTSTSALPLRTLAFGLAAASMVVSPAFAQHSAVPGAPASAAAPYRLVVGDKLRIEVYKDPQLSQSVEIRPDGRITLPLVGDVEASGRTAMELRDAITGGLRDYMTNPVVAVIVTETRPAVAYVTGEVNHPGAVVLQDSQLTVLQALALAGGLKDFADEKDIRIVRKSSPGREPLSFNYRHAIDGDKPVYLFPGDTVIVRD